MLFNSVSFLLFFPIVLCLYYLVPTSRMKTLLLCVASFYFYMSCNPNYGLLLFITVLVTYGTGCFIGSKNKRKWVFTAGVLYNIVLLLFYKYVNFISENLSSLFQVIGLRFNPSDLNIILPMGISFFTFKAISYLVDVYKGEIQPEKNFAVLTAYLTFFPQLLAGPIDRAASLIPQLRKDIRFNGHVIASGFKLILWGYFLKVVFADRACIYVDTIYDNLYHHNGTSILFAAFLYSMQIYCDFAGYSLISIGCAKAMGIDVPDNFKRPYFATSISELWKRWHISLTSWFTKYLYFSLGGNRCSRLKNYMNILIVFLVSGLWHGAAWNYVIWGGIHGLFQIIEKYLGIAKKTQMNIAERVCRIIVMFSLTSFAWIFFRMNSLEDAIYAVTKIVTSAGKPFMGRDATPALEHCALAFLIIFIKEFLDEYYPGKFSLLSNKNVLVRYVSMVLLVVAILLLGVFDNSQFIYMQY